MAMTRSEQQLVATFIERTSMPEGELLGDALTGTGANPLLGAYWALQTKGVLATDRSGIVTLDRQQAAKVAAEPQRYEALAGE